jgi:hypothetical protein
MFTLKKAFEGKNFEEIKESILDKKIPEIDDNVAIRNILNKLKIFKLQLEVVKFL